MLDATALFVKPHTKLNDEAAAIFGKNAINFCNFAMDYLHEKYPLTLWMVHPCKEYIYIYLELEINGHSIYGESKTFYALINEDKKWWISILDNIVKKIGAQCISTFFKGQLSALIKIYSEDDVNRLQKATTKKEIDSILKKAQTENHECYEKLVKKFEDNPI